MTPRSRAAKQLKREKLQDAIDMYAGPFEKSADTAKEEKKVFKFDEKHIKTEKQQLDDHAFQEYGDG